MTDPWLDLVYGLGMFALVIGIIVAVFWIAAMKYGDADLIDSDTRKDDDE